MCGRFTLTATPEEVEALFALMELEGFPPRYNIAPTQPILMVTAVIRASRDRTCRIGAPCSCAGDLIPGWVKDLKGFPSSSTPGRRLRPRRMPSGQPCAIAGHSCRPAASTNGKRDGSKKSQAYFIRPRGGGLVAFAGLNETWTEPGGSEIDTGAILTTAANEQIASIHDRMPVVIRPEHFSRWLDCRSQEPRDVADLLRPVEPGFFEAIPVSDLVNKVSNAGPDVQAPVTLAPETRAESPAEPAPQAVQGSLF